MKRRRNRDRDRSKYRRRNRSRYRCMNRFIYWCKDRGHMVKVQLIAMRVSCAAHSNTDMTAGQSRAERKKRKKQNLHVVTEGAQ